MPEIDWDDVANEAVELLRRYIRIDTTNPPGNEEIAADFLANLLASEGIESRKLISAPGRANLVADLPVVHRREAARPAQPHRRRTRRSGPVERRRPSTA